MQKSYREFLGLPIRDRFNKRLIGKVSDLVINPVNGEIVALFTRRDRQVLLPTVDIERIASDTVWVESLEALAMSNDIVRIDEIIRLNTPIFSNKVFTVSRQYLGEVIDFRFETNGWVLTKLDVAKKILGIPTEKKLINSSQIVRIKPNEITVRDAVVKVKARAEKRRAKMPDLAGAAFKINSK